MLGCPIRKSRDQRLFAPPPSLSQLITSFIASQSLGIHRSLLFAFFILVARTWFRHVTTSWFKYSMHSLDCSIVLHCFTTFSLFLSIYQRSSLNLQPIIQEFISQISIVCLTTCWFKMLIYRVSILLNLFYSFYSSKKNNSLVDFRGEYRARTDDPLRARQVL